MQFSYWEIKSWFSNCNFTIVGSGIVGLHTALALRKKYPNAKIVILEKGVLPQGASTKNAGFACFGSLSEIIDDLQSHSEEAVFQLIEKRYKGLQLLRENIGDATMDFQQNGGYELFLDQDTAVFESCLKELPKINAWLHPFFQSDVFTMKASGFGFGSCHKNLIFNSFEGQIDTGKMMQALLKKAHQEGILILNQQVVSAYDEVADGVFVTTNGQTFKTDVLLFATNGFAKELIDVAVQPARAQVLITKPIENLPIKGTFHFDRGYYYFRNIDNCVLFGGGRNQDFKGETTTSHETTTFIQNHLESVLKTVILPNTNFEIAHRWSGTMGVGTEKTPIVKALSEHVFCGVRMGGMGVAIGSLIGQELADLV